MQEGKASFSYTLQNTNDVNVNQMTEFPRRTKNQMNPWTKLGANPLFILSDEDVFSAYFLFFCQIDYDVKWVIRGERIRHQN